MTLKGFATTAGLLLKGLFFAGIKFRWDLSGGKNKRNTRNSISAKFLEGHNYQKKGKIAECRLKS